MIIRKAMIIMITAAVILTACGADATSGSGNPDGSAEASGSVTEPGTTDAAASESATETKTEDASASFTNEDTNEDAPTENTAAEEEDISSISAIRKIADLKADCETKCEPVLVDGPDMECPYDVTWDYGDLYEEYVDMCDWSLVFDAEYYKKAFPCLARQYNYDDEWLLRHFQTVGVHEGRQGCEGFNVGAYFYNCNDEIYDAFDHHFECFYIYYMLNQETESSVDTVNADKETELIYKHILTKSQEEELEIANDARTKDGKEPLKTLAELTAAANYRAYVDVTSGYYEGHEWVAENSGNKNAISKLVDQALASSGLSKKKLNENTNIRQRADACNPVNYKPSKPHWDALMNPEADYIGISHSYGEFEINNFSKTFELIVEVK